jgi:hypothetical protein
LLEANIADQNRWKIIRSIDLGTLAAIHGRAVLVGKILARTGVAIDALDAAQT